jgi:hypothetical protein
VGGTVRDECLNRFVFGSIAEACVRLNCYCHEYNSERPHRDSWTIVKVKGYGLAQHLTRNSSPLQTRW